MCASTEKEAFARVFGLSGERMRYYHELTDDNKKLVAWEFGTYKADEYMYAINSYGRLVRRREKLIDAWKLR